MCIQVNCQIRVKCFNARDLSEVDKIFKVLKVNTDDLSFNIAVAGPIRLPKSRKLFTILRSVHGDNKSREQFDLTISQQLWLVRFTPISKKIVKNDVESFWLKVLANLDKVKGSSYDWSLSLVCGPLSSTVRTLPFRGKDTSSNLVVDVRKSYCFLVKIKNKCHKNTLFISSIRVLGRW